jgi:outer membrane protein assembly factor BamA
VRWLDAAFAVNLRWESPAIYAGSKLAEDAPRLRGARDLALGSVAAGVVVDTRDREIVPTRGVHHQIGVGATEGSGDGVRSGEASAVLAHYAKLPGPFIFASRVTTSFQFGHATFYDQQQGGVFEPRLLFGGDNGVRGVPRGRYGGLVKVVANHEVRTLLPRFTLLGQRLRPGITALFDAGRVWADYRLDPTRDGTKLGLKMGAGGGLFCSWGEVAIVRVEMAYSPDAVSVNPGFPIGVYVTEGLAF